MGVDLDTFEFSPNVGGKGGHGGYAGPAVKPIALHLLSAVASDPEVQKTVCRFPAWAASRPGKTAVEFMLLGASVCRFAPQLCTGVSVLWKT